MKAEGIVSRGLALLCFALFSHEIGSQVQDFSDRAVGKVEGKLKILR